tara:strand:+ start:2239 stop:2754 length:516 start_codon:yes stop_codon:yes gene_type:complete
MDLKCVLNDGEDNENKEESIRVHKKPMQLRDIENRSSGNRRTVSSHESDERIKTLLNKEKKEIYLQTWNKLDNGMKINRLKLYVEKEKNKRKLSSGEVDLLKNMLITNCTLNRLNKVTDIIYNKEIGDIEEIKILSFNDKTRIYKLNIVENKKKTSVSKSKSNLDRFLKTK